MPDPTTVLQLRHRRQKPVEQVLLRPEEAPEEAAERLRVSVSTVRRLIREGSIPHVYLTDRRGGPVRIPVAALDEWWAKRQEGGRL